MAEVLSNEQSLLVNVVRDNTLRVTTLTAIIIIGLNDTALRVTILQQKLPTTLTMFSEQNKPQ